MSNYVQTTSFAPKDSLPAGSPAKTIFGAAYDTEFGNIATAIASKQDIVSAATGRTNIGLLAATKAAATNRANTTSVTADPDLVLALGTGTWEYAIYAYYIETGSHTANQQLVWQPVFSGTATNHKALIIEAGGGNSTVLATGGGDATYGININATNNINIFNTNTGLVKIEGQIVITIAGNISFNWGPAINSTNPVAIVAASIITARQLA